MTSEKELEEVVGKGEGPTTDFKDSRIFSDPTSLARLMVAFSNTNGGLIIIGIKNDKSFEGMKSKSGHEEYVMNIARTNIDPPISPKFEIVSTDKGDVYIITVPKMIKYPHALKIDGGKAYYIRVGSTVREPSPQELAMLFRGDAKYKAIKSLTNLKAFFEKIEGEKVNQNFCYRFLTISPKYNKDIILNITDDKIYDFIVKEATNTTIIMRNYYNSLDMIEFYSAEDSRDKNYCQVNDKGIIHWHEKIERENGVYIGRNIYTTIDFLKFATEVYNHVKFDRELLFVMQFKNVKGKALSVAFPRLLRYGYEAKENALMITRECSIKELNEEFSEVVEDLTKKFCSSFGFKITDDVVKDYVMQVQKKVKN